MLENHTNLAASFGSLELTAWWHGHDQHTTLGGALQQVYTTWALVPRA